MQLANTVSQIVLCYQQQLQLIEQELQANSTDSKPYQGQLLQLQAKEKQLVQAAVQAYQGNQGPTDLFLFFQVRVSRQDWVVRLRADQDETEISYDAEIYPCVKLQHQAL